jgi:hypothetical protein
MNIFPPYSSTFRIRPSDLLPLGMNLDLWILQRVVGLLGRRISQLQGRYLHAEQHREETRTDIHASSEIRTHDPTVRAGEDSSCLRQRGHCDDAKS